MRGTIYRITHELGGIVDQIVVTDGAGGRHFIAPALDLYLVSDRGDIAGQLPRVRRREVREAGKILGMRKQYFLGQPDNGYTLGPGDGFRTWDVRYVRRELDRRLQSEKYDVVLTLLRTEATHGHHQTVAILALEAVCRMPASSRPALAGVCAGSESTASAGFGELPGFPETRAVSRSPVWSFHRRTPLAVHSALDHSMIVNWVIAEHKSQGMFQMEYGRHTLEHFWQFAVSGASIADRLEVLLGPSAQKHRFAVAEAA